MITMVRQSSDRITYTADGWRIVAAGLFCLAFALLVLAPAVISLGLDGMSAFDSLAGWLLIGTLLVAGLGLAAFAFHLMFRESRQLDVMAITTTGLAYTHLDVTDRYSWSHLGELIYSPGSKVSLGSYRMSVAGEDRSIRIDLDMFGSDPVEMRTVITSARQGVLTDALRLRAKTKKDSLQIALAFLPIFAVMLGVCILIVFFHR